MTGVKQSAIRTQSSTTARSERMNSMFDAPSSRRATAVDQIKELILAEGLRPGDSLPTEAELCTMLKVSRSSVREAIRTLSTLGIVEVRHGYGTFVGNISLDALVETLVFRGALIPGDDLQALREIVEVRQALDLAWAPQTTASLAGTTNDRLHALVDEMNQRAADGLSFPEQDRAFHTELLAKVDNGLIGQLVAAFWDIHMAVLPRLDVMLPANLTVTAEAHGSMLRAAEAGDLDAYLAAVVTHYEPLMTNLTAARRNPKD